MHDLAFGSLIDSAFSLVDIETFRCMGLLSTGQFATVSHSLSRQEFYVGETIHNHGVRGQRQDILAIYDFANLSLLAEIDLPPKLANTVVNKASTTVTGEQRFLLIWNRNPSTSITVIDLDARAIINEIPTPGCTPTYPDERRGFIMLCGNGTCSAFN